MQARLNGWEFTRWGMPLSELIVVGKKSNLHLQDNSRHNECSSICLLAEGSNYLLGPFAFDVSFGFDNSDRLNFVSLRSKDYNCFVSVEQALLAAFGAPIRRQDEVIPTRTWENKKTGDTVRLVELAHFTILEYTAGERASESPF